MVQNIFFPRHNLDIPNVQEVPQSTQLGGYQIQGRQYSGYKYSHKLRIAT
jgi:hypothetical protein